MLTVANLVTDYPADGGPVHAVRDLSFEVREGELFTLLGPSGCGKSTTLRSIAGLEKPLAGEITVGGRLLYSGAQGIFVPPNQRNIGMVFQSYAIWPHMTVFENAAFPLRVGRRRLAERELRERVSRVLETVGLGALAARDATQLSGGQQQRLALARAIAMQPALLLLDEPMSNLDAKLRERMRFEVKRLQRELGVTTVYVTHDQAEALALSHAVAVMSEGRILQCGTPREIYQRPGSRFVAEFVGNTNFIDGGLVGSEAVLLCVRPEDVMLFDAHPGERGLVLEGIVSAKAFLGDAVDFKVRVGDRELLARAHPSLRTPVGGRIWLRLDPEKCVSVPGA